MFNLEFSSSKVSWINNVLSLTVKRAWTIGLLFPYGLSFVKTTLRRGFYRISGSNQVSSVLGPGPPSGEVIVLYFLFGVIKWNLLRYYFGDYPMLMSMHHQTRNHTCLKGGKDLYPVWRKLMIVMKFLVLRTVIFDTKGTQ